MTQSAARSIRGDSRRQHPTLPRAGFVALVVLGITCVTVRPTAAQDDPFESVVRPLLEEHCHECHGSGLRKGGVDLDAFSNGPADPTHHDVWLRVLRNVRAGLMPPAEKPRLSADQLAALERWIKRDALGLDPTQPDPGHSSLRRLNRAEYTNTVRDLMGVEFRAEEEFPPDDTGYGFDTIADVLSVSPMLLEKYLQAARTIVREAVPTVPREIAHRVIHRNALRGSNDKRADGDLSFYDDARVHAPVSTEIAGEYRVTINLAVRGGFDFDPGRCEVSLRLDGEEFAKNEYAWASFKKHPVEITRRFEPGRHTIELVLTPRMPIEEKRHECDLIIESIALDGPIAPEHWVRPKNYDRFFFKGDAPADEPGRLAYAREIIDRLGLRAFRRPIDSETRDRLAMIAQEHWREPGQTFESGIAQALVGLLASPRFLFRHEVALPAEPEQRFPRIDEWSLASRLSYFLWSTMPDDTLLDLARNQQLRKNLSAQVKRMIADDRSQAFVENFAGQWLQTRDIEGVSINGAAILRRDRVRAGKFDFDRDLRLAMKHETEMLFAHVMRENRSLIELIDCDYTFLNERLAQHYGISEVKGDRMRKVKLPEDSPRGGVLTHGSFLAVTSNPTRTSPVKRGLFVLDNILGTPAPPPPPDVPLLEDAENAIKDRDPTLREALELHRTKPLCAACHARMDPIGLALENFNAVGMWRDKDRDQAIDASGKLLSGEEFEGIAELKQILASKHAADFERCLTEKLLTYALGRGMEAYDVETVDQIVARLDNEEHRFSALLMGILESAPFQRRRVESTP